MKYQIIVDKQPRTNPSTDKKTYEIEIEELRCKGSICDSLVITKNEDYVIRRLALSEFQVLSILDKPTKETLKDINIELFEGENYIYLVDMVGNKLYAEYLVKNSLTDDFATKNEMSSAINQTTQKIELLVNQKLEGYATGEELQGAIRELNSSIIQKADEITSNVSNTYITKTESAENIENAKEEAIESANIATDNKLGNYTTTEQMQSAITQKADEITSTVSSTVETAIDNIEIGGRNLLLNSKRSISGSQYPTAIFNLAEAPKNGDTYTFSLKGTLGEGKTGFSIFNSGGYVQLATLKYNQDRNVYCATFEWKDKTSSATAKNSSIHLYPMPSNVQVESSMEWAKLEKGNKATDWTPAPEDIENNLETAKSEIKQTTDSISSTVSKKVGNDEIISAINQSSESVQIDANKISLKRKRNQFNRG